MPPPTITTSTGVTRATLGDDVRVSPPCWDPGNTGAESVYGDRRRSDVGMGTSLWPPR